MIRVIGPSLLGLLLLCGPARAIDQISLQLGEIAGPGWSLGSTTLELKLPFSGEDGGSPSISANARLLLNNPQLPGLPVKIEQMELHCKELRIDALEIACNGGQVRLHPALTVQRWVPLSFRYERENQSLRLSLPLLRWSNSRIGVDLYANNQPNDRGWRAKVRVDKLSMQDLRAQGLRHQWFVWPELNPNAMLSGTVSISRRGNRPVDVKSNLQIRRLEFSDEAGEIACEGVTGVLQVQASIALPNKTSKQSLKAFGKLGIQADAGQCYIDPVFVEVGKRPMTLQTDWRFRNGALSLSHSVLHDPGLARIEGEMRWNKGALDADLKWKLEDSEQTYKRYAQPFLGNSAAEDLELAGHLNGSVSVKANQLVRLGLDIEDFYIEDRRGRFALYALTGAVNWDQAGPGRLELAWKGGQALAFELGAASLKLGSQGSEYSLLESLQLPVLDGQLVLETATLQPRAGELPDWSVDGYLTPISLDRLSSALQWPILDGKLSGVIPTVSYRAGKMQVDGLLLARVFDGQILIRNLAIERPFGHLPRLQADVELKDLNLQSLTNTYEFGRIEGGLEGTIKNLVMENWQPSSFEAQLISPKDDARPHRISQRAIDNLTTVGSGVSGLFANPFLALFENFRYDRLGIACRLQRGRCLMSGVEDRDENGYYIVKGGGLPRIDVVGYQREVDWSTLLERLRSVSLGEGPEIR